MRGEIDEALKGLIANLYDDDQGISSDADVSVVNLVHEVWGQPSADWLINHVDATEDRFYVYPGTGEEVAQKVYELREEKG